MRLPKESATFSSCRFNFFQGILIPNSRYIEDRYQLEAPGKTFVLRCSTTNPDDSNIFFADGDTLLTLAYSPETDKIYLADSGEELERYGVHELSFLDSPDSESIDFDINSFIDSTEK